MGVRALVRTYTHIISQLAFSISAKFIYTQMWCICFAITTSSHQLPFGPHHIAFRCNGLTNAMAPCGMQRLPTLNGLYLFVHTPYRRQICALPKKEIQKKNTFSSWSGDAACIVLAFNSHVETELIRLYMLVCAYFTLAQSMRLPTCTSPLWQNYGLASLPAVDIALYRVVCSV